MTRRVNAAVAGGLLILSMQAVTAQPGGDCAAPDVCRQLALEAIGSAQYERAHDLAWRVVQTSPRRDRDAAALSLLARAQSLSGRGYDAFVILQRLADMGVAVHDAETSDDFRRVREYPGWPELQQRIKRLRVGAAGTVTGSAGAEPSGAPEAVENAVTRKPVRVGEPASSETSGARAVPSPAAAPLLAHTSTLTVPPSLATPSALAYDAVSARFVLASGGSDVLRVLSETSGNAVVLVSSGWSGTAEVGALAIDRRNGDLWVAGAIENRGVAYRLQLISGRLREQIDAAAGAGSSRFVAMALGARALFLLDDVGRRVFRVDAGGRTARVFATLPADAQPTGLAFGGSTLYVSHTTGVLRVDAAIPGRAAVAVSGSVDVANLQSIAWHEGALLGIQRTEDSYAVVRVRLNRAGTQATGLETLQRAASPAGVLAAGTYYYVAATDSTLAVRGINAGR
jgi:hypothetical protein